MSSIGDRYHYPISEVNEFDANCGSTYRQWLIGMALQGLLANPEESRLTIELAANLAIRTADAVIASLDKAND